MFGGGFLGFFIFFVTSLCGITSWWWLVWGGMIGVFVGVVVEIIRFGGISNFSDLGGFCDSENNGDS